MEDYNGNVFPRLHDACQTGNVWTVIWGGNIIFCEAVDSWDWEQWHFDLKNVNDLTLECRFCQKLLVREKVRERKKSDKNLSFQTHFEEYHNLYYDQCVFYWINQKVNLDEKNKDGNTPLHLACSGGHVDIVPLLIYKKVKLEEKNRFRFTPLNMACQYGLVEVIKQLIEAGVNLQTNVRGGTYLH